MNIPKREEINEHKNVNQKFKIKINTIHDLYGKKMYVIITTASSKVFITHVRIDGVLFILSDCELHKLQLNREVHLN